VSIGASVVRRHHVTTSSRRIPDVLFERRSILAAASALAVPACSSAGEKRPPASPPPGSGDPKARAWGRVRAVMASQVDGGNVPGLVMLVSRGDDVYVDAIGAFDFGRPEPMRRDTIFRISSMTKPVTAVSALMLVEESKLGLDDPIERWLPELANRRVLRRFDASLDDTVPARRSITVRDLLTFRMGFGQVLAPPQSAPILEAAHRLAVGMGPPEPSAMPEPNEWLRRLGSLPLMCQPGERWMYNTGSDVLGVLVGRASGQAFPDFLRERLFEPLGMKDTGFFVPRAKLDRLPASWWNDPKTGSRAVYDPTEGQWSKPPLFASGAAGLVSTVDDYFAFARMLLRRGEHRGKSILSSRYVETMTRDQLTPDQKDVSRWAPDQFAGRGWGFGVSIVTDRAAVAPRFGSYGWDGGLGTTWRNQPEQDAVTLLMTQRMWTSPSPPPVCRDFWTTTQELM
jgi:CubicO group peptidase (beta-lactamase class C family)